MTAFRTCHTCEKPQATCPTREALRDALAGLGVTSVKHRCADYRPAFQPGDAVKVLTLAWYHRDDEPPPKLWFPGHFIRLASGRALVFVQRGAEDLNGEAIEFEPNSNGYLRVPLSRVAHREAAPADVEACRWCAAILGVGDPCGRDPHYTPSSHCLAEQLAKSSSHNAGFAVAKQRAQAILATDEPSSPPNLHTDLEGEP